jgi:crotonobetainyl-CoA:carnitine CoA-transferase CaiB-like acyl-CoA transferase
VGQHVFTSLAAGASFVQSVELTAYAGSPEPVKGARDFPGPTAGHRLYQVGDGWVAIAATTDDAIHRLLAAVGHPEWSDFVDGSPADAPGDGPLAQRIAEALAGWETTALIDALTAGDVTACRVLDRSEELDDAWLAENGFFHLVGDSALGRIQAAHHYADWNSETELDPPLAPVSALGGDSRAVLREAGFSSERINKLLATND